MSKHTPIRMRRAVSAGRLHLDTTADALMSEGRKADAQELRDASALLGAAPELHEALREAVVVMDLESRLTPVARVNPWDQALRKARAALAKVDGESK
jgi:hypothetical protein